VKPGPKTTREPPPAADTWDAPERRAWRTPPTPRPGDWTERHYRIRRGDLKGPWRHNNAPYLRGVLNIANAPGVVQLNLKKAGRVGGSEALRAMIAFWAATDPSPMGLTLPNQSKGRSIMKGDVLPIFRHTAPLRELLARESRDALTESVTLQNGFSLELAWAGSAAVMASSTWRRAVNDEVDKFGRWSGDESGAIEATEGRITTYQDRRLQVNISTPTTTAGTIHTLYEQSTVRLEYHVPCPHCGRFQPLRWANVKWMSRQCAALSLEQARAALAAGATEYAVWHDDALRLWKPATPPAGSVIRFASAAALQAHIDWLTWILARLTECTNRRQTADVLSANREQGVWYQCAHCMGRVHSAGKAAMLRAGRWTTEQGFVIDADGVAYEDAEQVERWPAETRIGMAISGLACTWIHWGLLASQWLRSQNNPEAMFFFMTFRLGEAFEFRSRRVAETVFSAKSQAARLEEGIVPRWAAPPFAGALVATIDTQPAEFYVVVRAWGAGMRSARVWHGRLPTFEALDQLVLARAWAVEGGGDMAVHLALIDSGGTLDKLLEATRTQQVYTYAIGRQPLVTAIKGASQPTGRLFWPMRNPMSQGGKAELTDLHALMLDPHVANDLLSEMIPARLELPAGQAGEPPPQWDLNRRDDPEYNAHLANVQRTVDPGTGAVVWTPKGTGTRHDYRDCEAYQVVGAYLLKIHALGDEPAPEESRGAGQDAQTRSQNEAAAGGGGDETWETGSL
jgi:phage terminase large subunit GpA-like protein